MKLSKKLTKRGHSENRLEKSINIFTFWPPFLKIPQKGHQEIWLVNSLVLDDDVPP